MRFDAERLLSLLPAVYRIRDAERGELRALLGVLAGQIGVLEDDIAQLYDDEFIDTCAPWVIPYIGDLLGNTPLFDGGGADEPYRALFPDLAGPVFVPRVALRDRSYVAKTIYYRKRTATRAMLEELAADVTGWPARVVEFFEILRWTQFVRNHLRLFNHTTPDLRNAEMLDRIDGPFDTVAHNVDVRPISTVEGWHETRNIGFFLWRLRSHSLVDCDAFHDGTYRFHANRAGIDAPLFTRAKRSESAAPTEVHLPGPIRQKFLRDDLQRHAVPNVHATDLYGIPDDLSPDLQRSLSITVKGVLVEPRDICASDLSAWRQPKGKKVAVDVRRGRIAFGADWVTPANVRVSYHYGFAADLGGGPYPRSGWLVKRRPAFVIEVVTGTSIDTLGKAVAEWESKKRPDAIIRFRDNRSYVDTGTITIDPPPDGVLIIEARDRTNPHIRATQPIVLKCGDGASVTFSGLLIEGTFEVQRAAGRLRLLHTTLVPAAGKPSIAPSAAVAQTKSGSLRVEAAFSILGALRLPPHGRGIALFDCIVDGAGQPALSGPAAGNAGPSLHVERSTFFGGAHVVQLPLASESIFTGELHVDRRQEGCARFSFIPAGSHTPRRYRCQPDLETARRVEAKEAALGKRLDAADRAKIAKAVARTLAPSFTSIHYGDPGYAQLDLHAPPQIARGAEDGSEMGVFCHLKQPQRESNLRMRLEEHLPFGLQPGIIYVT